MPANIYVVEVCYACVSCGRRQFVKYNGELDKALYLDSPFCNHKTYEKSRTAVHSIMVFSSDR